MASGYRDGGGYGGGVRYGGGGGRYEDRRPYDGGRDRDRDFRGGGRRPEGRPERAPTVASAPGGAAERRRRRGPSLWDVREDAFVPGSMTSTNAAPPMDPRLPAGAYGGSAPSQQTRHARRLYVGGLADQSESEISTFFADLVRAASLTPVRSNPILSVYVNTERKFAFVEFNSIELANAFMELDGLMFKGHPVKIRRPDDYNPGILPPDVRDKKEPLNYNVLPLSTAYATGVAFGANVRMHVGGIPPIIDEPQLMELVAAFGAVRRLEFPRHPDGTPQGFAFVEYVEPATCDLAIAGLNNLPIGDATLSASIAKTAAPEPAVAPPAAFPGPYGAPGTGGFDAAAAAAAAASIVRGGAEPAPPPSRILVLENMVSPAELANDVEYADIRADIRSECSKYGALVDVVIPRPPALGAGRVFLHYEAVPNAQTALTQLNGRQFGPNTIRCRFYDEAAFRVGHYSA